VKKCFFVLFIMAAVLVSGCARTEDLLELKITNINSSLGAFQEDPKYQAFSYEIIAENVSAVPVDIDYAGPIILENVKERMKEADLTQSIDATMEKNDVITLKGTFLFKADDLSKEEILSFNIISGVMVYTKTGESHFVK
jgi:hypothetical protein